MAGYDTASASGIPRTYAGGGNGPITSAPPTESASKIRDGLGSTEQLVSELQGAIKALEQRLDTVLTPCAPEVTDQGKTANIPIGSHFNGRVDTLNLNLTSAVRWLTQLRQRVEV